MIKILAPVLAAGLFLSACSFLQTPVGSTVTPAVATQVQTQFATLDLALIALPLVPGVTPDQIAQAKAIDISLQAAWKAYTANPNATNETAILTAAILQAQTFVTDQHTKTPPPVAQ